MKNDDYGRKDIKIGVSFKNSKKLKTYVYGNSIDEIINSIEVWKDMKFLNEFVKKFKKNLSKEQLSRLDKIVLGSNKAKQIVKYAVIRKKLENIAEFEDKIIGLNKPYYIYMFSKKVKNVNIRKMETAMLKFLNTDCYWCHSFAKDIEDADITKFEDY